MKGRNIASNILFFISLIIFFIANILIISSTIDGINDGLESIREGNESWLSLASSLVFITIIIGIPSNSVVLVMNSIGLALIKKDRKFLSWACLKHFILIILPPIIEISAILISQNYIN